ncbi:SDR family NAD(P)-dependent oxidoreductase [Kribbella kalugense]|uniref:Short-subunit dehydrogenase n=1 Tax=Kribbella kalugense TaxID=2512221 RepID=A0A4R7ZGW4_9ACTN|nr:SDR family NAD(P)-dependent oxidoreductase [Kribbella kalugense]TDW15581.1 short-subunit dehydrogenase [Kribbella kalugense]
MQTPPVVVLTGATNGLGRLAVLDLARQGAHLALVVRSERKAAELQREIEQAAPGTTVEIFLADLSLLADVRRVGRQLADSVPRIDVLINNAGVHAFEQRVTSEGLPEMTVVNYLAPWLLTDLLRGSLTASAPARIVNVASRAANHAGDGNPLRYLGDTAPYSRRESSRLYGWTKLLDVMFTQELGRQLKGTGVAVSCCCPGFNVTGLGRDLAVAGALEKVLKALNIGNPQHGADIIVQLATDPTFAEATGGFFAAKGAKPLTCPPAGRDESIQRELWQATADFVQNTPHVRH